MPDVQIFRGAVAAVPMVYTVPDSAEIILKCVNADFDGSGAGGAYLPCVSILSDSGHVIARAVDQAVSVAAGASAEVSWFPGVKHAAASVAASGLVWATAVGAFTASNGANATTDALYTFVATNDAGVFSLGSDELRIAEAGLYVVSATHVSSVSAIAATISYFMRITLDGAGVNTSRIDVGGQSPMNGVISNSLGTQRQHVQSEISFVNVASGEAPMGIYTQNTTIQAPGATLAYAARLGCIRISDPIAGVIG